MVPDTVFTRIKLHWQILIAILLAAVAGELAGVTATIGPVTYYSIFDFVGTLFINALKMLIVPLISSSIVVGVAGIAPPVTWVNLVARLCCSMH